MSRLLNFSFLPALLPLFLSARAAAAFSHSPTWPSTCAQPRTAAQHCDKEEVSFLQHSLEHRLRASPHKFSRSGIGPRETPSPLRQIPGADTWNSLHGMSPYDFAFASGNRSERSSHTAASFGSGPVGEWNAYDAMMLAPVVIMLVLFDIFLAPRIPYNIRNHVLVTIFMLVVSATFCAFFWACHGKDAGIAWATGFVMEWAMSVDNLFGFHLIFRSFAVPASHSIHALTIGVYLAMPFRVVLFLGLTELFRLTYVVNIVVGALLIISGVYSLRQEESEEVEKLSTVRFFKWLLGMRLHDTYSKEAGLFTVGKDGKTQMTMLFLVVCVIPVVDCMLSIDNVTSQTGQIKSLYINLTSCLLAMYCLRAFFFIIKDAADYFEYAQYGVSAILCFLGFQMIVAKWCSIPLRCVLLVICVLFTTSMGASVIKVVWCGTSRQGKQTSQDAKQELLQDGPPADVAAGPPQPQKREYSK